MRIVYRYRTNADGSREKYPVYIPETEEERRQAEEELHRDYPGYYAGFSEVYANPDHPLHDRVTRFDEEERQRKEAAKTKSDDS